MLDPGAHLREKGFLAPQVVREAGALEIRRGRIGRHVAVPCCRSGSRRRAETAPPITTVATISIAAQTTRSSQRFTQAKDTAQ